MSPQAERDSAAHHIRPDLEDLLRFREKHHIDRELHSERMDAFRADQQSVARFEARMFQESGTALGSRAGFARMVGQHRAPRVGNPKLPQSTIEAWRRQPLERDVFGEWRKRSAVWRA